MTPVILLTGFLGSGKTTLLSRLLADEFFRDTAVIVNEFGAVSLDHDLIRSADESIVVLGNGCICCRSSSDIARALNELRQRRADGEIAFQRVIIETSGLADPVPLLQALSSDLVVAMAFSLAGVVTVIDAVAGAQTLERYEEARRQVAMADLLLISKTDLNADVDSLMLQLSGLNQTADCQSAAQWRGELSADRLQTTRSQTVHTALRKNSTLASPVGLATNTIGAHSHQYCTVSLLRETPLPAAVVPLFLEGLAAHLGDRLLRMKGVIALAESTQRPMVVHSVQHMVYAPQWLDQWPSEDRRTRIVLIGHQLPQRWPSLLLDMLEAEVDEVTQSLEQPLLRSTQRIIENV